MRALRWRSRIAAVILWLRCFLYLPWRSELPRHRGGGGALCSGARPRAQLAALGNCIAWPHRAWENGICRRPCIATPFGTIYSTQSP